MRAVLLIVLVALLVSAPAAAAAPRCDDACMVAGARAYVAALVSHDPRDVPFHPRATRVEAGIPTGFSGRQLAADLRFGPQYRVIRGVHDEQYSVAGDTVTARFVLDVGLGPVGLTRVTVHETFRYEDGLIREIVATFPIGAAR